MPDDTNERRLELSSHTAWKIPTVEQQAEGPQGLWAPGDYLSTCKECRCLHIAAKHSLYCYDHRFGPSSAEPVARTTT